MTMESKHREASSSGNYERPPHKDSYSRDDRDYRRDHRDHHRDHRRGDNYDSRDRRDYRDRDRDRYRDRDYHRDTRDSRDSRDYQRDRRRRSRSRDRHRRSKSRGERKSTRYYDDDYSSTPMAGVLPLSQWPRKIKVWDVPPVGFENWTAEQAKSSGLFALASHNVRDKPEGGFGRGDFQSHPAGFTGLAQSNPAAQSAKHVKQARRIFLGDLPPNINETTITDFFNEIMEERYGNGTSSGVHGRPVVHCQIQADRSFAFVEFRTAEEATQAIKLDGVNFHGSPIRIRRPKEYVQLKDMDILSGFGMDSEKKLFIGEIPTYLTDEQVKELLQSFGELLNFFMAKDDAGVSKGYAFCEYMNQESTETALSGLNGLDLGDKRLIVERASSPRAKNALASASPQGKSSLMMLLAVKPEDIEVHPVLMIVNIVSALELQDDEEYEDICEDIRHECEKYGKIVSLYIPRPSRGEKIAGIGKVFVEYENNEMCQEAVKGLHGRRFNERVVVTGYFPRDKYLERDF